MIAAIVLAALYFRRQIGSAVTSSVVFKIAEVIANEEGWGGTLSDGSPNRPTRNNNPGDLKPPNGAGNFWAGQVGVDSEGFAIFATANDGWAALMTNIRAHIARHPGQTILQWIESYAPASDGNDPASYAAAIAAAVGSSVQTALGDL